MSERFNLSFETKKHFGLIFANRMYVVAVPYREDRGALFHLPLRVPQMADFVIDLTEDRVLKCRMPDIKEGNKDEGRIISSLFYCVQTIPLSELLATEPRLAGPKTFEASPDNVFSK